ncbi:hypothetical protein RFI_31938 [Reticulomyxa filosa]|uniref:Uncharacterized protein n=1 Tax=Reticulomyxa filosa TaxID=46433 RepID=X6LWF1_RETFI|nr:hypothetical protein RFI_31938 [Reticulomyxa filosa]|eukprot:ETO05457.1 hypothetical protein RFI_31938 [Reticulomyxa filosa]
MYFLLEIKKKPKFKTKIKRIMASKVNVATQNQQQWKDRYEKEQECWSREQVRFDDEMTAILQGMEANELTRLQTVGDCLRKWAVFTTNVCANRTYDIQSLAQIMSLVRPKTKILFFFLPFFFFFGNPSYVYDLKLTIKSKEKDLQSFMWETLAKRPQALGMSSAAGRMTDNLLIAYDLDESLSRQSSNNSLVTENKSIETEPQDISQNRNSSTSSSSLSKMFSGLKLPRRVNFAFLFSCFFL